jgi:hypothetical protein
VTTTLAEKAVAGRRVTFTYHRDRNLPEPTAYPGIITGTEPGYSGSLLAKVRLDGRRSNLRIPLDYEGLHYLDEVIPVPDLPMGRFHPTADDFGGDWEGVPVCSLDNEAIVILTADRLRAAVALAAFCKDMGFDQEYLPSMEDRWAVFEWQPEDAEIPWFMDLAEQDDDQAIHIHYLPA